MGGSFRARVRRRRSLLLLFCRRRKPPLRLCESGESCTPPFAPVHACDGHGIGEQRHRDQDNPEAVLGWGVDKLLEEIRAVKCLGLKVLSACGSWVSCWVLRGQGGGGGCRNKRGRQENDRDDGEDKEALVDLGAPLVDLGAPFVEFGASHRFSYRYRVEELHTSVLETVLLLLCSLLWKTLVEWVGRYASTLTPDRRLCMTASFCSIWVRMFLAAPMKCSRTFSQFFRTTLRSLGSIRIRSLHQRCGRSGLVMSANSRVSAQFLT